MRSSSYACFNQMIQRSHGQSKAFLESEAFSTFTRCVHRTLYFQRGNCTMHSPWYWFEWKSLPSSSHSRHFQSSNWMVEARDASMQFYCLKCIIPYFTLSFVQTSISRFQWSSNAFIKTNFKFHYVVCFQRSIELVPVVTVWCVEMMHKCHQSTFENCCMRCGSYQLNIMVSIIKYSCNESQFFLSIFYELHPPWIILLKHTLYLLCLAILTAFHGLRRTHSIYANWKGAAWGGWRKMRGIEMEKCE